MDFGEKAPIREPNSTETEAEVDPLRVPKDAPNDARIEASNAKLDGLATGGRIGICAGGVVGGEGCMAGAWRGDSEAKLHRSLRSSSSWPPSSSLLCMRTLLSVTCNERAGESAVCSCGGGGVKASEDDSGGV